MRKGGRKNDAMLADNRFTKTVGPKSKAAVPLPRMETPTCPMCHSKSTVKILEYGLAVCGGCFNFTFNFE